MSGDYSRKHFRARDNYSGVLEQQGRVHLDWEHNEAGAIQDRRWRAESIDLIGRCGVSDTTPEAFRLTVVDGALNIGVGRLYVDGLQAENHGNPPLDFDPVLAEPHGETAVPYLQQPYAPLVDDIGILPGPASLGAVPPAGQYLAFLDVWQREVTHHQAPELVETALGIDTTARLQTVWQVKLLKVDDDIALRCDTPDADIPGWDELRRPSDLRLSTGARVTPSDDDPCLVSPEGGYRGLDNLLYRVEVHAVVDGVPRIKWSRHNASIVANVTHVSADRKRLTLDNLGRDDVLRFSTGDWVEITDDDHELLGIPGIMRRVTVNDAERTLSFDTALNAADFPTDGSGRPDPNRHMRVVRWDQRGRIHDSDDNLLVDLGDTASGGVIPVPGPSITLPLEHGLLITLDLPDGGIVRTGDHWCFAVRTADASVEALEQAPPLGIHHHFCRLAVVRSNGEAFDGEPMDCRRRFPPLTQVSTGGCRVTVGEGGTFERLDEAIEALLEEGVHDLCLCLLAGEHETKGLDLAPEPAARDLHLSLSGCGPASHLRLVKAGWRLRGLGAVSLRDLSIEAGFPVEDADGAIALRHCAQVNLTGCFLRGLTLKGPLLSITAADQVRLRDNQLEASTLSSLTAPQKIFDGSEIVGLAELFRLPADGEFGWAVFREKAGEVAKLLAELPLDERQAMQERLQKALGQQGGIFATLSNGERTNLQKLALELGTKKPTAPELLDIILDIRRAAIKARPGLALVLGEALSLQPGVEAELGILDEDDLIGLESNDIAGILSLYGLPASEKFLRKVLTAEFLKSLQGQVAEHVLHGIMGTLSLRGNQLVRLTVSEAVIERLQAAAGTGGTELLGLFARCLLSGNVIEGDANLFVARHLTLDANAFSLTAAPRPLRSATGAPARYDLGTLIADSSIYTGNHAQKETLLTDVSGSTAQAANLAIDIKALA